MTAIEMGGMIRVNNYQIKVSSWDAITCDILKYKYIQEMINNIR